MKLAVISHVHHWQKDGRIFATGGFVKEIDYWARLFDELELCVPLRKDALPTGAYAYESQNIRLRACPVAGGLTLASKIGHLLVIPMMLLKIFQSIRWCDAMHIRCPGNMGFLGLLAARFTKKPRVGKYAGEWSAGASRYWSVRVQRNLIARASFGGPVLINSLEEKLESPHLVPVFNTTLTEQQAQETSELARKRCLHENPKLLFVGRLSRVKCVEDVIKALHIINQKGEVRATFKVIGDGPIRVELESLVEAHNLSSYVTFHGMMPASSLGKFYAAADIFVLASSSEGWPKVLMEAMLYGLPCIASAVSVVPYLLGDGKRGILVEPGKPEQIADAVQRLVREPGLYKRLSIEGREWVEKMTLEDFVTRLKMVLEKWFGVELHTPEWMDCEDS